MRLERSTYVKIALIVLLCLGVCGFFGGCGRGVVVAPLGSLLAPGGLMGCVGWNAIGEIAGYAGDAVGEMAGYFLELPADTALTAQVDKTSGNFTNDFAGSAGDPSHSCDLTFDIISSNLEVLSAE